jgi:hypothetical protein
VVIIAAQLMQAKKCDRCLNGDVKYDSYVESFATSSLQDEIGEMRSRVAAFAAHSALPIEACARQYNTKYISEELINTALESILELTIEGSYGALIRALVVGPCW